MASFRVFRTPKTRKFDYNPQYWDPKKEELKERLKQIEELKKGNTEVLKSRISKGFKRGAYIPNDKTRSAQVAQSNRRLLIIIVVLILIAYFVLSSNMPSLIKWLE